jgi:hypothetical protein
LGEVLGREAMHFNLELAVKKYLDMAETSSDRDDGARGAPKD